MQKQKPDRAWNSRYATFNLLKVMQPGELFVFLLSEPGKTHPVVRMVRMLSRGGGAGRRGTPAPLVFVDVVSGEEITLMFSSGYYPKKLVSAQPVRLSAVQNDPLDDLEEEEPAGVEELDFDSDDHDRYLRSC